MIAIIVVAVILVIYLVTVYSEHKKELDDHAKEVRKRKLQRKRLHEEQAKKLKSLKAKNTNLCMLPGKPHDHFRMCVSSNMEAGIAKSGRLANGVENECLYGSHAKTLLDEGFTA